VAQVTVQFAMVTPMSGVPLVMTDRIPGMHPADFRISGCIVVHVLAMFVPGFFVGDIIALLGELRVMGMGLLLQASCMIVCLTGSTIFQFYVGLCLLGVGWNLAFVSGTLLLVKSHTAPERTTVTSLNETLRFAANGVAVLLSSSLQWETLMYICVVSLLPAGVVILLRRRGARAA